MVRAVGKGEVLQNHAILPGGQGKPPAPLRPPAGLQFRFIGPVQALSRPAGHQIAREHLKGVHHAPQQLADGHGVAHAELPPQHEQHTQGDDEKEADGADDAGSGVHRKGPLPPGVVRLLHVRGRPLIPLLLGGRQLEQADDQIVADALLGRFDVRAAAVQIGLLRGVDLPLKQPGQIGGHQGDNHNIDRQLPLRGSDADKRNR